MKKTKVEKPSRQDEVVGELSALLATFEPHETSAIAAQIIMHFEEKQRESTVNLLKYKALLTGDPELGIDPDPSQERHIKTCQAWRAKRKKAIAFFKLVQEYAMIVEAPAIIAAIREANGEPPKYEEKPADARVVDG